MLSVLKPHSTFETFMLYKKNLLKSYLAIQLCNLP